MTKPVLTTRQRKVLAALLSERTVEKAALAAGVTERTVYKYLAAPVFRRELTAVQDQQISDAVRRLTQGLNIALDELERLMTSADSDNVRRQAVSEWLTHALRLREFTDFEARLSALEERVK